MTNYYDLLKSSNTSKYFSYLNEKYIELVGPTIKVFKLDKHLTEIDELYGTETHSRIYLPPFEMKVIHLTNPWQTLMDTTAVYEKEERTNFVVNFDNMVKKIRDLKDQNSAEIIINYAGTAKPEIEKSGNIISIYLNGILEKTIDINIYNTFKKFSNEIQTIIGMKTIYKENEEMSKILDFNKISFKNEDFVLYIKDMIYDKMTDVIEMGDVLLTEKWRAYEVKEAYPTSDFGWDYATYTLRCDLIELDVLDGLPGDYRTMIEKHQYGMRKIRTE